MDLKPEYLGARSVSTGPRPRRRRLRGVTSLSVLLVLCAGSCGSGTDAPGLQPNLVLITIDTLRADHLGCYGHSRPLSPSIDQLAESGLLFERALSAAPWTLPSMASLHTSLYPLEHGAIDVRTPLPDELTTLAEVLQGVGYETMAFVTHVFVSRRYGFAQGFRVFNESLILGHDAVTSDKVTSGALQYLRRLGREPFFLWVHYFDPHFSYVRHRKFKSVSALTDGAPERLPFDILLAAEPALLDDGTPDPFSVETVKAIYVEEIAFTDAAIGDLVEGIHLLKLDRPTITVLTSDHGEYFMERDRFGHGRDVYNELVHVPLIISGDIDEALKGHRFSESVEVASVAHTLTELAGVEGNPFQGENLLDVNEQDRRLPIYSFGCYAWGTDGRKIMVESNGWKLIQNLDDNRFELYDVGRDSREHEDQWKNKSRTASTARGALREMLQQFTQRRDGQATPLDLSREEIERLEALGYVQ